MSAGNTSFKHPTDIRCLPCPLHLCCCVQVVHPITKPYKHYVLSAEEYKAQRQQDLLKATGSAASSSHASGDFDIQAGQQQQQQQAQLGAGGDVHPGALGMPAATGLDIPLSLPLVGGLAPADVAAADAATVFQQFLQPAEALHMADATAAAAAAAVAAAAPQQLLLPPSAPMPAVQDSGSVPDGYASSLAAGALLGSSSLAALIAALAAAQARGSISDQLNMADDAPEQAAILVAAAAAAPGSIAPQPEVLGWVNEMSRETVLGQTLHLALTHAVRMQEPVMLPSGHKVFPDGRVVMCVVNNELGLMLPAGSQDLEATRAQVAAAISAGLAGSSSMAAAVGAAGWGSADAQARVVARAGPAQVGGMKDGSDPMAAAMLAAASAAAAFRAAVAEQQQ
jgi:hypothetical protein